MFLLTIKGIKDKRFTSNPIHAPNQEEEEMEIKDPKIIIEIKRSRVG
jgi:hypothetical protein